MIFRGQCVCHDDLRSVLTLLAGGCGLALGLVVCCESCFLSPCISTWSHVVNK